MTWIEKYTREFAIPALYALMKAERAYIAANPDNGKRDIKTPFPPPRSLWYTTGTSHPPFGGGNGKDTGVQMADIKPMEMAKSIRPMTSFGSEYPEVNLIWSAITSFGRTSWLGLEDQNNLKTLNKDWLAPTSMYSIGSDKFTWAHVAHSIVKNSWRSLAARADGRTIILPGRDVWAWYVIAQKSGYKYRVVYDPRVSRGVKDHTDVLMSIINSWGVDLNQCVVFDTGFAGSIYNAIVRASGRKPINVMLSTEIKEDGESCQIFPKHTNSRAKALAIEYLPKPCDTARVRGNTVYQPLVKPVWFIKAVALTIFMWYFESPAWIPAEKKPKVPRHKKYSPFPWP